MTDAPLYVLPMQATLQRWNSSVTVVTGPNHQAIEPNELWAYMYQALSLVQTDCLLTIGQASILPGAQLCSSNVTSEIAGGVLVPCPSPALLPVGVNASWPPPVG